MKWNKSDWYIPPDWMFLFGWLVIFPLIAIEAGVLLPILGLLKSAGVLELFYVGIGTACFGILLLLVARWPLYRQHQFFNFGPSKLPSLHRKFYWLAYAAIIAAVLLLGVVWLRVND
jgi:hypothetical protein